ncbi:putative lumazine-binding protein [Jejuia pallidilutea]|uniref:Putative lumazine-binding protein n=1 Tax=Jejuia pallidilutea TaxID=504487 RepID=A0A362WXC1_9FLAO|nr:nuclear transport factor 2 family protein [Jejuia pallidilutea]PQV44252.1 putative lumazine-binding protein [Jejuia pallidilutea]
MIISCKKSNEAKQLENSNSELEAFITDYYSVMSQRNWNAYKAFFADKATLTTIWQEPNDLKPKLLTNSITEFLAQTENGPDSQPIFEEKPIKIDIKRKKNLANAWVYYEAKFGTEDNLIKWKGYDLISLLKFDNKWYITSITYVSD